MLNKIKDLFEGLRNEETWAIVQVSELTYNTHVYTCKGFGIDADTAADLHTDALVYLIKGIRAGKVQRGREGYEDASVVKLLKQNLLWARQDHLKKRLDNPTDPEEFQGLDISNDYNQMDQILQKELARRVEDVLSTLEPEDCIELAKLRIYEELSWDDIAERLGKVAGSLRNRFSRVCLPALKELFTKSGFKKDQ